MVPTCSFHYYDTREGVLSTIFLTGLFPRFLRLLHALMGVARGREGEGGKKKARGPGLLPTSSYHVPTTTTLYPDEAAAYLNRQQHGTLSITA